MDITRDTLAGLGQEKEALLWMHSNNNNNNNKFSVGFLVAFKVSDDHIKYNFHHGVRETMAFPEASPNKIKDRAPPFPLLSEQTLLPSATLLATSCRPHTHTHMPFLLIGCDFFSVMFFD